MTTNLFIISNKTPNAKHLFCLCRVCSLYLICEILTGFWKQLIHWSSILFMDVVVFRFCLTLLTIDVFFRHNSFILLRKMPYFHQISFPQNFHSRNFGEITVFYVVFVMKNNWCIIGVRSSPLHLFNRIIAALANFIILPRKYLYQSLTPKY